MAQATKIEWTNVSWNPVHGCSKVSAGCNHCYAETLSLRRGFTSAPWTARNAEQNVTLKPHKLREPLSRAKPWDKPCRVFVNSMSDLFHEQIPDEYIAQVFAVMGEASQHTFQILTKRPERMAALLSSDVFVGHVEIARDALAGRFAVRQWPLPNVWLGVSIENRKWVGRADILRDTPAAVRFISAEPLLGPLVPDCADHWSRDAWGDGRGNMRGLDLTGIDWLIVGGESGPGHRPFDPQWARDLRDACMATRTACTAGCHYGEVLDIDVVAGCCGHYLRSGECCGDAVPEQVQRVAPCPACGGAYLVGGTAFFMKQLGGSRAGTAVEDLPEDLRIREFPVGHEREQVERMAL